MLSTMYILVHFKLSFKNTLTSLNRVKIPIFAAAAPSKCEFFHLIFSSPEHEVLSELL